MAPLYQITDFKEFISTITHLEFYVVPPLQYDLDWPCTVASTEEWAKITGKFQSFWGEAGAWYHRWHWPLRRGSNRSPLWPFYCQLKVKADTWMSLQCAEWLERQPALSGQVCCMHLQWHVSAFPTQIQTESSHNPWQKWCNCVAGDFAIVLVSPVWFPDINLVHVCAVCLITK